MKRRVVVSVATLGNANLRPYCPLVLSRSMIRVQFFMILRRRDETKVRSHESRCAHEDVIKQFVLLSNMRPTLPLNHYYIKILVPERQKVSRRYKLAGCRKSVPENRRFYLSIALTVLHFASSKTNLLPPYGRSPSTLLFNIESSQKLYQTGDNKTTAQIPSPIDTADAPESQFVK